VQWESKVTKEGLSKPLSTGTPVMELFE